MAAPRVLPASAASNARSRSAICGTAAVMMVGRQVVTPVLRIAARAWSIAAEVRLGPALKSTPAKPFTCRSTNPAPPHGSRAAEAGSRNSAVSGCVRRMEAG